jgi:hypothetical protein
LVLRAWPMLGLLRVSGDYVARRRPWHFPVVQLAGPAPLWATSRS